MADAFRISPASPHERAVLHRFRIVQCPNSNLWWTVRDSNSRPPSFHPGALPAELPVLD